MHYSKNTLIVLLVIALTGQAISQTFDEGVVLEQPGNNVEIEVGRQFNFSNTYLYSSSISFGGSEFSVNPTNTDDANLSLYHYNDSIDYGEKLAGFNATSEASEVEFSFTNLVPESRYKVYLNGIIFSEPLATAAGELSFKYTEWSTNAFEIFRRRPKPQNVSITLKGDYSKVVADGTERTPGTFTDLEFPYIVMENDTNMEGLVAFDGYNQASYVSNGHDKISITKAFDTGRFLLLAANGTSSHVDRRQSAIMNDNFLGLSRPSFTNEIYDEHTVTVMTSYDSIDIFGDAVIETNPTSELRIEAHESSGFGDVVEGGQSNVSITVE